MYRSYTNNSVIIITQRHTSEHQDHHLPRRVGCSGLTFGGVELVSGALTPASGVHVRGVGVDPEVVAIRVAVKMQTEPVATHLGARSTRDLIGCIW